MIPRFLPDWAASQVGALGRVAEGGFEQRPCLGHLRVLLAEDVEVVLRLASGQCRTLQGVAQRDFEQRASL